MKINKFLLQTTLVLSVIAIHTTNSHYHEAYFHSAEDFGSEKYNLAYSSLPDDLPLSRLSLLAAHNSPTYDYQAPFPDIANAFSLYVKCQALSPYNQLYYGNRVLDVRVRRKWNQFELVHGPIHLNRYFGPFLSEVLRFLNDHPREFAIIAIQEDADQCASSLTNCEILQRYIDAYGGDDRFATIKDFRNNTLKDVRGKIVFVGQEYFNSCNNTFDMFNCDLMMNFDVKSQISLVYDIKWKNIKEHIHRFTDPNSPKRQCSLTFLGGNSFPVTPPFIVSGHVLPSTHSNRLSTGIVDWFGKYRDIYPDYPRTDCIAWGTCTIAYEGTNILTNDILAPETRTGDYSGIDSVQIIATDFFGISLARHIIEIQNYRVRDWQCKGNFLCTIFGPDARGFNYNFNDSIAIKHQVVNTPNNPADVVTWRMNLTLADYAEMFETANGRKGPIFSFPNNENCHIEIKPFSDSSNVTASGDIWLLMQEMKDNDTIKTKLSNSEEYTNYLNSIETDNTLRESLLTNSVHKTQSKNFLPSLNNMLTRSAVSNEMVNYIKDLAERVNNHNDDLQSVIAQSSEIQKLIIEMLEPEYSNDEQFISFKEQYNLKSNKN